MSSDTYTLHSTFDIEQHKKKFPGYFEALILKDGTVVYAVPSHQQLALRLASESKGKSEEEISSTCPQEYWCDYLNWLLSISGAIAVWDHFYEGWTVNQKQIAKLRELKLRGIYHGFITSERSKYIRE